MIQDFGSQPRLEKTGNLSSSDWSASYVLNRTARMLFSPDPLQEAIQALRISGSASEALTGRGDLLRDLGHLWQLCSSVRETVAIESDPPSRPQSVTSGYRSRELEWLWTHKEVLQQFAGQWVVLEGEKIVAHGNDPLQVVTEARAKGVQVPYIFRVEITAENEVRMGL
jgi:hypothetical protein